MDAAHRLNYQAPPGPPGPQTRTILGHPVGLFLLFIVEMWERFSYYGMRGLLVLYLKEQTTGPNPGRGFSEASANNLYGWYTGMCYLMPLFGGMIADKLIGTHRSMVVGGLLIAMGHVALAVSGMGNMGHTDIGMSVFIFGLALIVLGTGHFKPTVSVMVGQLYPADDPRRDGAFTIFYMGINVGAFICAFVCGTLGEKVGWHWGFGAAAVGMLLGLFTYTLGRPYYLKGIGLPPDGKPNIAPLFIILSIILSAGFALLVYRGAFTWLGAQYDRLTEGWVGSLLIPCLALGLALAWSARFIAKQERADRGPTACILIFVLFNAVFWLAFEQAGSSLNIFAKDMTNRHIGSWEMPATWFQSVNPLLIITLAPLFAWMWSALARRERNPSQPMKIAMALLLVGGGYVFMVFGAIDARSAAGASMVWLTATYLFHTLGELCISPTGLSFISRTAPVKYVSFLVGLWFLSSFAANKLGGTLAAQMAKIGSGEIRLFWYKWFRLGGQADFFLLLVVIPVASGLLILLLTPLLKKMLAGRE